MALEFDHGNSIGKWATQLIKAIRSTASSKIDGVLFCFCLDTKSAKPLFIGKKFTTEFQSLIESGCQKPVGIITIDQVELSSYPKPTFGEMANFLRESYGLVQAGQGLAVKIGNRRAGS